MLWWLWSCARPPEPPIAAACASCHPEADAAWRGSRHARAERELGPDDGWARALGGARVIGVSPVVQALVPADGGRLQAHASAWDPRIGESFELFDDGRAPGEWGHWTGGGNTWNSRCAACHVTGFVKGLGDDGSYASRFDALGVGCAACHGDATEHAAGGPPPANPRMDDTCASCHALRSELGPGFRPGAALLDHYAPTLLDDARFGPDGRALDEVFEANQLVGSRMHAGGARCADCHRPHDGGLRAEGDALCARCHDALGPPIEHAAHPPGVGCVDCHMPPTVVMQRHARRDHAFTSPRRGSGSDACASCHPDRPATAPPDPRVEAFAAARAGGPWRALDLADPVSGRRAAAHALLARHPADAEARAALRRALSDGDPLVRFAAAGALVAVDAADRAALGRASDDPVRAVRVAAQRALVHAGAPLADAPDLRVMLDHHADDPVLRAERGALRVRDGDPDGHADLEAATRFDPGNPELFVQRAVALARAGRPHDAIPVLEAAPAAASVDESLGLALAGAGRPRDAIAALERSVARDPSRVRAWRNLALLLAGDGRTADARQAAERALALAPDPELAAWAAGLGAR